jgi:hypothetical protein
MGLDLNLFSSALKLPTQYMHTLQFTLELEQPTSLERVMSQLNENPRIALTEKMSAGLVFSFGRDHGYYGRILNEAVVPHKTLHVSEDGHRITGFCYTPQDGNSLLSSMAATLWYMDGSDPKIRLQALRPYMFQEI